MQSGDITLEFTCRKSTASCDKFSMRSKLIPVRWNELLGSAFALTIQVPHEPCSFFRYLQRYYFVKAKRPTPELTGRKESNQAFESCG
jgi:hypothetical protein